jgi:hypothetical protein
MVAAGSPPFPPRWTYTEDCDEAGHSLLLAAIFHFMQQMLEPSMRQFGFFLGIAIGVILILFGSIVIFQALPAALDVLEMPSRIPFVREVYTWLMSSANGLTAQLEQNFLEAFQTVLKLILLITFMWVCVKLVNMGVLIIRAGVDLIRTAIAHSEGQSDQKKPDQHDHF